MLWFSESVWILEKVNLDEFIEHGFIFFPSDAVPVYGNTTAQYFKYLNVSCNGSEQSLSTCQTESVTSSVLPCKPAGVVCPGEHGVLYGSIYL